MARLLNVDTTQTKLEPANGVYLSLKEMQKAVEGYIEFVYLNGLVLVVNESGLVDNLPLNFVASAVANQPLVGPVIVLTRKEFDTMNREMENDDEEDDEDDEEC